MNYKKTSPCDNCPFRHDVPPFITPGRATDIINSEGMFPCHKTTVEGDADDGDRHTTDKSQHCAGFLILREKMGKPNQLMRIAERFGDYDARKLDMAAPVYASARAMVKAHMAAWAERKTVK